MNKFVPTALIVGRKIDKLNTIKYSDYECTDINVINVDNSSDEILNAIYNNKIDVILTFGKDYKRYKVL